TSGSSSTRPSASVMSWRRSMTSQYRPAAVSAMSASASRKPSISMGMRRTIEIVTAATTVPTVVHPWTTPQVPTATIAAWAGRRRAHAPPPGVECGLAELEGPQPLRDEGEPSRRPGGAAEGLEDPDALNGLLDIGRDLAHRVLRPARGLAVALLEDRDGDDRRDCHDDHDQSEDRLHEHEDDRADGEHDRGRQEEGQSEGEEAPQHGQIVDRAREQLAGLPGVVDRHRGVLQSVEQARAPGDLPARDHGGDDHAAGPHSDRLGDADDE